MGFKQCIPSKPAKYGLKMWVLYYVGTLCACRMHFYMGKAKGAPPDRNQGMMMVLKLMEGLQGHTITTHNFFTCFCFYLSYAAGWYIQLHTTEPSMAPCAVLQHVSLYNAFVLWMVILSGAMENPQN